MGPGPFLGHSPTLKFQNSICAAKGGMEIDMAMFGIFGVMFSLVFFTVIGIFVYTAVTGFRQWNKNNNSPRLTVPATVVSKRTDVSHHHHGDSHHHHTSTTYYVTFQVESGDRMELHVAGVEYGMLAEGDFGSLSFQGTRFLGFERS